MEFLRSLLSSKREDPLNLQVRTIAHRGLTALGVKDYHGMTDALQELWLTREEALEAQNWQIAELVDEWAEQIVEKTGGRIEKVDQPNAFFAWMKAYLIATARKQSTSRGRSIPEEAKIFVESTGLGRLPMTTFSLPQTGKKCPPSVLSAILRLLDSYPKELAAVMIVRRFPPPMAGTFMFTLRDMKDVRPEYSEKAMDVLACAFCWMKDFETAQQNLFSTTDAETREAIGNKLNSLAETLGWEPTHKLFSEFDTLRHRSPESRSLDQPQVADLPSLDQVSALAYAGAWKIHLEKASALFDRTRMAEAQSECEMARDLARKQGNLVGEALSLSLLGRCKIAQGNLEEAHSDLEEAHQKAMISGDAVAIANVLDAQGIYFRDIGQLDKATDPFERALEICYHPGSFSLDGIGATSANLARTCLYLNRPGGMDLNKAEEILVEAARTVQAYPNRGFRGRIDIWQMLALVFIQKGELEKAFDCLEYTLLLKQQMSNLLSPAIEQLGKRRRTRSDLLPILDYLDQELYSALHGQDIHSKVTIHFFKAKAHIELARRVPQEKSRGAVDLSRSRLLSKDYDWHLRQAQQLYASGIDLLERELRARLSETEARITFLQYRLDAYEEMVLLCLKLDQQDEANEYVERSRSRVFLDQLAATTIQPPTTVTQELITTEGAPTTFEEVKSCLQNV